MATQDIAYGTLLLEETPVSVCHEMCSCDEAPILPQHLYLAILLASHQHGELVQQLTSGVYDPSPLSPPLADKDRYWSANTVLMLCLASSLLSHLYPHLIGTAGIASTLARLPLNTHAVSAVCVRSGHTEQRRIALALYAMASAVNHSCIPNSAVTYPNLSSGICELRLSATRDLKAGEEVVISYGVTNMMHAEKRRRYMQLHYLFLCHCVSCDRYLALQKAPHGLAKELRKNTWLTIRKIGGILESILRMEQENEVLKHLSGVLERLRQIENCIASVEITSLLRYEWYYDMSAMKWRALDTLARIACRSGDYLTAVRHMRGSVNAMTCSGIVSPADIVVLREQVKIAEIEDIAGNREVALRMAREVLRLMSPHVVDTDPDWLALLRILYK